MIPASHDVQAGTPVRVFDTPNDPGTFVFEKDRPSWSLVVVGVVPALGALILA